MSKNQAYGYCAAGFVSTRSEMLGSALACLAILLVKDHMLHLGTTGRKLIKFLSHYSFHVYLTHILAFTAATAITVTWVGEASSSFYWVKLLVSCGLIAALCTFLEAVQCLANRIFARK